MNESEAKKGGATTPTHIGNYQRVAAKSEDIFKTLFDLLKSKNEAIKLGAAKVLANKILPDLKSVEVGGELDDNGKRRAIQLLVNLGGGFIPPTLQLSTPSAGGFTASTSTVQSSGVAPESTENMDSSDGNSETGTR